MLDRMPSLSQLFQVDVSGVDGALIAVVDAAFHAWSPQRGHA